MEVTRYINNIKISGEFPSIILEKESIKMIFQQILQEEEKEGQIC